MFEFDPGKSALNKEKHGIDFEEAQALWADGRMKIIGAGPATEIRYLAIGRTGELLWSAVFTIREPCHKAYFGKAREKGRGKLI